MAVVGQIPTLSTITIQDWIGTARKVRYLRTEVDGFDRLLKIREALEEEVEKVNKECRTRGYLMIAGQIGTGIALFLPFAKKNFNNNGKKITGLVIYLIFMMAVGLLIGVSLWHLMKKFIALRSKWENLLIEAETSLRRLDLICDESGWKDKIAAVPAISREQMYREDQAALNKMKMILEPLEMGWMGENLVWVEMGTAATVMVAIPVIATFSRLT